MNHRAEKKPPSTRKNTENQAERMPAAKAARNPLPCTDSAAANAGAGIPCSNCGHRNDPNAKFCVECGTKQGSAKCPNCQSDLPLGAKFCNECGQKV